MFHSIGLFFRFLYHFFFIDQKDGRLSHTKFFSVIGYMVWCWAFPYAVVHGSQASFELWMVFGAVVIGNHTLQTIMLNKAGVHADEAATWKGKYAADSADDDSDAPPPAVVAPVIPPPVPAAPVVAKPAAVIPDTSDLLPPSK